MEKIQVVSLHWFDAQQQTKTFRFQKHGLNNHRKDFKKPDAILAGRHFQERNHIFNKHAKFIIIDKLTNTTKSKDILRQRLIG